MTKADGPKSFYDENERRALEHLAADRAPDPAIEDRIVGVLRRRGLLEAPREQERRVRPGIFSGFLGFLKPALVGAAVVGAFVLGRSSDTSDDQRALEALMPTTPEHLVASNPYVSSADRADAAPQRLVVLGDEDRRYEYYVDEKGQSYYVLVKLPIPTPISTAETDRVATRGTETMARTVPGMRNNRFEYYFDTHGNAYGVVARDEPAADLFATR